MLRRSQGRPLSSGGTDMSNTSTSQSWVIDTEVEDFLLARQVQGVSPGTGLWHKHCLSKWRTYCVEHGIYATQQTTPKLLRVFVARLQADGHNEGGITNIYRSVKAFLRWYENEVEPLSWRSPTRKVKISVSKPPLLEPVNLDHFREQAAQFIVDYCIELLPHFPAQNRSECQQEQQRLVRRALTAASPGVDGFKLLQDGSCVTCVFVA